MIFSFIYHRSEQDEETLSETKIHLDEDDEGYEDEEQGNNFLLFFFL